MQTNTPHYGPVDRFAIRLARGVIRFRWLAILLMLLVVGGAAFGVKNIGFSTNYRIFFSDENPQLTAFDALEKTYSKTDNVIFVLKNPQGTVFDPETLAAVREITEKAWLMPYVSRVDSLSNYQHTYAEGDDLIVTDLVENDPTTYTPQELENIRDIAINEPLLKNRLVNARGDTTGIAAVVQFTREDPMEVVKTTAAAREIVAEIKEKYPQLEMALSGMVVMNNSFMEASMKDMGTLIPIMYGVLLLSLFLFLRSVSGTVTTLLIMAFSTMFAMGMAGWLGIKLTPPSASAPTIILTLAIADSVHILVSFFSALRKGMGRDEALVEAMRINLQPVTLTSLTTAVGFLSLNFSDAPPFGHLGNITAMGVMAALVFSVVLVPACMSLIPFKAKQQAEQEKTPLMEGFANFVIAWKKPLLVGMSAIALGLSALIPTIELNDQFVQYFDKSVPFRNDTDFMIKNLTGVYTVEYSLPAKNSGGINEPEYLAGMEKMTRWLHQQPEVIHVYALTDIYKRLNKNLHGDDEAWYRVPDEREMAAQYLLLYEMSLPYGLDLNDRINVDKSASRVTVTIKDLSTREIRAFYNRVAEWKQANLPAYMQGPATGTIVMFSYISERNIESMTNGNILAILLISLLIGLSLGSLKIGGFSLIPNLMPIGMAFGLWALIEGQVNMASAMIMAVALGIVVDDTVHFLSKYFRARREKGLSPEDSVRYAFTTVGRALVVTTLTLVFGFGVLAMSTFQMNQILGLMTAIAITCALIVDFLLLPAALLIFDKDKPVQKEEQNMTGKKAKTAVVLALIGLSLPFTALAKTPAEVLAGGSTPEEKGYAIAQEYNDRDEGFGDSQVTIRMILRNAQGEESTREMRNNTFETSDPKVGDKTLIVFDQPRDVAGSAFLTFSKILDPDDQWLYLPTLKRVKRVSSKNKSGPFMGSEFAYEDISSQELGKYSYKYLRTEACPTDAGLTCFVIEAYPQYEHSGYTKQIWWLDQDEFRLQQVHFYDRKDEHMKTLTYVDYQQYLDKYWRAARFEMVNHQTGKSTTLFFENYQFRLGQEESDFTEAKLKRAR